MLDPNLAENGKTHSDVQLTREELDKLAAWLDMLIPAFGDYEEGGVWDDGDRRKFAYYKAKKQDMHELDVANNLLFATWQKEGTLPPLPSDPNPYRNLALNPKANASGWQVDFAKPIQTDQLTLTFQANSYWKECTIECSNGFTQKVTLQPTADRQVFRFPVQNNVTWLKLTNIVPERTGQAVPVKVEVLGIDQ